MFTAICFLAALPCVYGKGSNQLGKAAGFPSLRNTTILLKTGSNGNFDHVLVLKAKKKSGPTKKQRWMSPGGEIDGTDNRHRPPFCDTSFEEALVREFLEETGLPTFPKVQNAVYVNWGSKKHTRVFIAETTDRLNFQPGCYQRSEVVDHKFEPINNLRASPHPFVNYKGKQESCRNADTFKQLLKKPLPGWAKPQPSGALKQFEGAYLASKGHGNIVVMKGQQPPAGFRKGAHWHQNGPSTSGTTKPSTGTSIWAKAAAATGVGGCAWWNSKSKESAQETQDVPDQSRQHHEDQTDPNQPEETTNDENGGSSAGIILFVVLVLIVIAVAVWLILRKPSRMDDAVKGDDAVKVQVIENCPEEANVCDLSPADGVDLVLPDQDPALEL